MPGIYIHIPFCKQTCHYCDFHFSTSLKLKDVLLNALLKEIELQKNYFGIISSDRISSIYFGGGTPSLLSGGEIKRLIDEIKKHFSVLPNAEITLEANPDDLMITHNLKSLRDAGINRLSIGVQSFFDEDLRWMNRAHDEKQALLSLKNSQEGGFNNITIDLIYGTPILTTERWGKNLQTAFELNVQHLSCYALTVEPRTALAHFINSKQVEPIDEEKAANQFELLMNWSETNGFEQYEISNFARDQNYSVHNSSYWKREKYIGIGPSAHSYDGVSRQWNVRNNSVYIESIKEGRIPYEREELTEENRYNEYIMTSLRTMWGCNLEMMRNDFGNNKAERFLTDATRYLNEGFIQRQDQNLILTKKGKLFADKIAAELFVTQKSDS